MKAKKIVRYRIPVSRTFPSRKFIENMVKFGHIAEPIAEVQITNILRVTEREYNDYLKLL